MPVTFQKKYQDHIKIGKDSYNLLVNVYKATKMMSDEDIKKREGHNFDESHYLKILKNENADVYGESGKLLLKIRRKVIPKDLTLRAVHSFVEASKKKHENRGAASGILDRNKLRGYVGELLEPSTFRSGYKSSVSGIDSKQKISNLSPSNIVGFFDKPDRNLKGKGAPCRMTAFNRDNVEKWGNSIPYIKRIDRLFKHLTPNAHKKQLERAQATPKYAIADTSFSTITINYSWRTGMHKDAGDYQEGYGNLVVCEDPNNPNTYTGCYTGFPQYGVAADVRNGDFLAMDVHEWHCNTEFKPTSKKIHDNKSNNKDNQKNVLNNWHYNRLSLVHYLREGMMKCKNLKNRKNIDNAGLKSRKTLEQQGGKKLVQFVKEDSRPIIKEQKQHKILNQLPKGYIKMMQNHGWFL